MLVIWRYCDVDPKVTSVFTSSTSLSSLFLNVLLIEFLHVLQLALDQLALILKRSSVHMTFGEVVRFVCKHAELVEACP